MPMSARRQDRDRGFAACRSAPPAARRISGRSTLPAPLSGICVDEHDGARNCERRAIVREEVLQLLRRDRLVPLEHHHGGRRKALGIVRERRHRDVGHVGVLEREILHLLGVDVLAAADEHVVDSGDVIEEAVGIAAQDVAGAKPAVPIRSREKFRQVDVFAQHIRAADPAFALVPPPRRSGATSLTSSSGATRPTLPRGGTRPSIGCRIAPPPSVRPKLSRTRDLERLGQALDQLRRHDRRAHRNPSQGGEVERFDQVGLPQHLGEHGGHAAAARDLVVGERLKIAAADRSCA